MGGRLPRTFKIFFSQVRDVIPTIGTGLRDEPLLHYQTSGEKVCHNSNQDAPYGRFDQVHVT